MNYKTYNVYLELEGYPVSVDMEIPEGSSEQEIFDYIMDSIVLEWDEA